ncbi:PREDICTED: uncharacterized protein LOC108568651 isoform X2 [Nicrophorus vespilloides]|uniref:Gustatory receptor n=1 Tax=Nicrophorus vespilloides TaxID=110193 RepID=A0ABM1NEU8_NICVS|nr:PREDICTED: uncharacterized protein LOC108568651 isoform X2 [Nicrophorus vespilloides]
MLPTKDQLEAKLYGSLKPITEMSAVIGLLPKKTLQLKKPKYWKLYDYVYVIGYTGLYLFFTVYTLYYLYINEMTQDIIPKEILVYASSIALMQTMIFPCVGFRFRHMITRTIRQMVDIDYALRMMEISIDYGKNYRDNIIILCSIAISIILRAIFSANTIKLDVIQQVTLVVAVYMMSLVKFQYVAPVNCVLDRFRAINRKLKTRCTGYEMNKLCKLHFRLCHCLRLLNTAFGCQIFISVSCSFIRFLFQLYFLYNLLTKRQDTTSAFKFGTPIFYIITEIVEIYMLVNVCAKTKRTAEKTPIIIHALRAKFEFTQDEDANKCCINSSNSLHLVSFI